MEAVDPLGLLTGMSKGALVGYVVLTTHARVLLKAPLKPEWTGEVVHTKCSLS